MSEWKEYKLGDFAEVQTGPFGSQLHASDYVAVGIPSLMPVNIGERLNIKPSDLVYVKKEDIERLIKYTVKEGDIVYSRRGDVEKCAYINAAQSGWLCGTGCLRIRVVKNDLDSKFCAYYLSTPEIKSWVTSNAVGTTMPNLNSTILGNLPLALPPLPEQRAIAAVLSSLDDKIELLHRQNATLEAMAEALFRQWFVVEAKEEWEEKSLLDAIELVGGGTPKTSENAYWDGDICWLSGGDIASNHKNFVVESEKKITLIGLENSSAKLLPRFSTVISARGTVGKYCLLSKPMTFSQSNYGIKPKFSDCYFFTYLLIAHCVDELQAAAYGSVFDTITTNTFKEHIIQLPTEQEIYEFEEQVKPLFFKMLSNQTQIRTLTALRDTLLPKLMSGEVRVKM